MTKEKKSSLSAEAGPAVPQLLLLKKPVRRNSARTYRYAFRHRLVGGIFRNNGRYTAAEECIAMGAGDLFTVMEALQLTKTWIFPVINTLLFTISIKSSRGQKTAPEPRHQAADG